MSLPVFVIMAGGRGERFWPRSRRTHPKQLLSLVGEQSLLQASVERIRKLTEDRRIYVVTNRDYVEKVRDQLPMLPERNILVEPESRNTAPCVGLAATYIASHFRGEDPVMAILPSDLLVRRPEFMRKMLQSGIDYATAHDVGVIYGAWPTRPETGYGYIQLGKVAAKESGVTFHEVAGFKEKPDSATAAQYLVSQEYLWNGGIFVWRVRCLLQELAAHLPQLATGLETLKAWLGTAAETERLKEIYPRIPAISFDYGILEKTRNIVVIPADFGWDDLGSWNSLERYLPQDDFGNVAQGDLIALDSSNCIVYSERKPVVTLGVSDLIIVEAEDSLLVCAKQRAQDMKKVLERLREEHHEELL
ncbi:mannose-1-phosphate guanylyltransferase [Hydrogenispora ethanolica]|uniref:mannose-1-phosphate guanylyltransferase n=1 Tax=Hydrogenispora ethanolica TaxID=1082276 RepID=A0A4R1RX74_HYDET|nr:mannose-1-phosphate guanylyltransferase [Hydrogenispora ethanolica]TCL70780.1 mannose-1-phosphate guanylyltransferase [Hydrogenispora ethanolica]